MADAKQYPYAAYFKLYGTQNLQVSFTVMSDLPELHLKQLDEMLLMLFNEGYRVEPEGLEQGEVIREADSWVLGKTSHDEPCVYLYKFPMKWRVATIYKESIPKLPFTIPANAQPILGSPPERDMAERQKILHTVPDFKVVLTPTGSVDKEGRPRLRFDRVYGATTGAKGETSNVGKVDPAEQDPLPFDENISYTDALNYMDNQSAQKFVKAARDKQAKSKKSVEFEQLSELISKLDNLYGETGYAEVALCIIAGINDVPELDNKLSAEVVKSLDMALDKPTVQEMVKYLMTFAKQIYGG